MFLRFPRIPVSSLFCSSLSPPPPPHFICSSLSPRFPPQCRCSSLWPHSLATASTTAGSGSTRHWRRLAMGWIPGAITTARLAMGWIPGAIATARLAMGWIPGAIATARLAMGWIPGVLQQRVWLWAGYLGYYNSSSGYGLDTWGITAARLAMG